MELIRGPRSALRRLLLAMVVAMTTVTASSVSAQAPDEKGLKPGPWWVQANASGRAIGKSGPISMDWRGRIAIAMEFTIREDGSASGTWEMGDGKVNFSMKGRIEGRRFKATGRLTPSGGGRVRGTDRKLRLDGRSRSKGSIKVTAGPVSSTINVPRKTEKVPTIRIRVRSTTCNEAWGDWEYAIEQAAYGEFKRQGFDVAIDGFWIALREVEELGDHAQELLAIAAEEGADARPIVSESYELAIAAALLRRYNDLVDRFPNWEFQELNDLLADTEAALNGLRNISDCERQRIGGNNVEEYENALAFIIQNLIIGAEGIWQASAESWQNLVDAGYRTGALGPGAPNRERAAEAEGALIDAAQDILERNVDPDDGLIWENDTTTAVFLEAAMQGWGLNVADIDYDATGTWNATFGRTDGTEP